MPLYKTEFMHGVICTHNGQDRKAKPAVMVSRSESCIQELATAAIKRLEDGGATSKQTGPNEETVTLPDGTEAVYTFAEVVVFTEVGNESQAG